MNTTVTIMLNTIERVKKFVDITVKFASDIDAVRDRYVVDAKSIMGLFSMDLLKPVIVKINSSSEEEIRKFNEAMEEFV